MRLMDDAEAGKTGILVPRPWDACIANSRGFRVLLASSDDLGDRKSIGVILCFALFTWFERFNIPF